MKHLLALMALCVAFAAGAQVSNDAYDPDADGDNNIGVNDLLALLSLFGENDVDDDGIWDSVDDCLADSCTKRAYLIAEPLALAAQIGTYMYYNGATHFYGFSNGSNPLIGDTSDIELYLSFWDQYAGTEEALWADYDGDGIEDPDEFDTLIVPGVIHSQIPQISGGYDEFGNPKIAFRFNTLQVPLGYVQGSFYWTIIIADESMTSETTSYRPVEISIGGTPSACNDELTLPGDVSSVSTYFEGSSFPAGNYRIYNLGVTGANLDVESGGLFYRCSGIAEFD